MSLRARARLGLLASMVLLGPGVASAQLTRLFEPFDLQAFRPRPLAECSVAVGCAETGPAGSFRLSAALQYSSRPLVLLEGGQISGRGLNGRDYAAVVVFGRPVLELLAAWSPIEGLELHGEFPFVVSQFAGSAEAFGVPRPGAWGTGTPSLGARWTILSQRRGAPLALAVALDLLPPIGWREALAGNGGWLAAPRLEIAYWSDLSVLALELGGELRQQGVRLGQEWLRHRLTAGLVVSGRTAPVRAEASLRAITSGRSAGTALELLLGVRFAIRNVELYALAGPGFMNAAGFGDARMVAGVAWGHGLAPVKAPAPPPAEP
jgi:hypothetical protein